MRAVDLDDLLLVEDPADLTPQQIAYLRDNPELLDLFSDRETLGTRHLWRILVAAIFLVAISKVIAVNYEQEIDRLLANIVVDLVFEMGAALIGSAATVIFIQHRQRMQFIENIRFRAKVQQMIDASVRKAE